MPPRKHHYIPIFYLKRWTKSDGKLVQFCQFNGRTVPTRKHPAATGFQDRLYGLRGVPDDIAFRVEQDYFFPVDSLAAEALAAMEDRVDDVRGPALRSAWTRFVVSLLLRCPEDIELFRSGWRRDFVDVTPDMQARYEAARGPDDPLHMRNFLLDQPEAEQERMMYQIYLSLLNNPDVGRFINGMTWSCFRVSDTTPEFLTSDRPVVMTNGIDQPDGHIAIPIGPRHLFLAANRREFIDSVFDRPHKEIVGVCNTQVVEGAVRFVYASSDKPLRFVQKHISAAPQPRLVERMIRRKPL